MSNNQDNVSPHWAGFKRLWIIVAIILFLFLLITWLMGYGPGGKNCIVEPTIVEKTVEVEKIVNVEKIVMAPDTLAPKLGIKGLSTVRIVAGQSYTDAGLIAVDNIDGTVDVKVTGNVDTKTPGTYTLTYTATDTAGNTSTETRTIIVEVAPIVDTTAPVISVKGNSRIPITFGSVYVDEGATAMDSIDGKVSVKVTGMVDTSKPGDHILTYSATDSAGNLSSETRTVTVGNAPKADTASPVINLIGSSVVKIPFGSRFVDLGATAMDAVDGKTSVNVTGLVQTNTAGIYELTYTSSDAAGNKSSVKRKVIVESSPTPPMAKVYFKSGSAIPPADTSSLVKDIVSYMNRQSAATIKLSGYHDATGNITFNQNLANSRAISVSRLLQRLGIPLNRITIEKPAISTGTGTLKEARRVEVMIVN